MKDEGEEENNDEGDEEDEEDEEDKSEEGQEELLSTIDNMAITKRLESNPTGESCLFWFRPNGSGLKIVSWFRAVQFIFPLKGCFQTDKLISSDASLASYPTPPKPALNP